MGESCLPYVKEMIREVENYRRLNNEEPLNQLQKDRVEYGISLLASQMVIKKMDLNAYFLGKVSVEELTMKEKKDLGLMCAALTAWIGSDNPSEEMVFEKFREDKVDNPEEALRSVMRCVAWAEMTIK